MHARIVRYLDRLSAIMVFGAARNGRQGNRHSHRLLDLRRWGGSEMSQGRALNNLTIAEYETMAKADFARGSAERIAKAHEICKVY